jgi:hypothetical protein
MRGAMEELTRENLSKSLSELVGCEGCTVTVNDKKLPAPLRVRLRMLDSMDS